MNLTIKTGDLQIEAELFDTPTAAAIARLIPIRSAVSRWGGEIYFAIPVKLPLEDDSRDVLEAGEIGYWPTGKAFCIFFGSTPASEGDECRAASNVNVFGKVKGDLSALWDVKDGQEILVTI